MIDGRSLNTTYIQVELDTIQGRPVTDLFSLSTLKINGKIFPYENNRLFSFICAISMRSIPVYLLISITYSFVSGLKYPKQSFFCSADKRHPQLYDYICNNNSKMRKFINFICQWRKIGMNFMIGE